MKFAFPRALPFIVIGAVVALLYWPGLYGGFFFDDIANLIENSDLQIKEISVGALKSAWESGSAGPLGRPISMVSFAANYYFCGFVPFCFKLTNLVIHGINSFLVYGLLRLIAGAFEGGQTTPRGRLVALLLALIWAVHPIQLTSVLYVVQRMTSISATFVLAGLLLHISARQMWAGKKGALALVIAWCVAFPLALLSKETGVLFIGYVFAYELLIRRHLNQGFDRLATWFLSIVAAGGAVLMLYLLLFSSWLWSGYEGRAFTLPERLLTEARIVWNYLGMIFAPALPDLALFHDDVEISSGILAPISTAYSVVGLVVLITLAWHQRLKRPLVALSITWFLIGHSLESSLIPLELMHEHRNYLPSLALAFLCMHIACYPVRFSRNSFKLIGGAGVALLIYLAVLTYLRADMYGDDIRRTQIEVQYHEKSVRSQYEAGALIVNMYHQGPSATLVPLANKHFEQANLLDPTFKMALVGMLQLDCLAYKTTREDIFRELERRLGVGKIAVQERTTMSGIAYALNAGTLCLSRNQADRLFASILSNSFALNSDKTKILNRYAMYLWLGQKDYVAAQEALDAAFSYGDSDPVNRLNAIQLMRVLGDKEHILRTLEYLDDQKLSEVDHGYLVELKKELVKDGTLRR